MKRQMHYALCLLLITTGCSSYAKEIALYIHGTKIPGIDIKREIFGDFFPKGLHCASTLTDPSHPHTVINALCTGKHKFIKEKKDLYFLGWDGLFPTQRAHEAQNLYDALSKITKESTCSEKNPLRIHCISHSHGGAVLLYLVQLIDEKKAPIVIDELVLMGCPIQQMTEKFAHSATVKKIYNIYSKGDELQKKDPQGLYPEARINGERPQLLSRRTFSKKRNCLWEISIKVDDKCPGHQDFITPLFLLSIAQIITEANTHEAGKLRINLVTKDYKPIEHVNLKIEK